MRINKEKTYGENVQLNKLVLDLKLEFKVEVTQVRAHIEYTKDGTSGNNKSCERIESFLRIIKRMKLFSHNMKENLAEIDALLELVNLSLQLAELYSKIVNYGCIP